MVSDASLVVDASVLVLAFTDSSSAGAAARDRMRGAVRHAPHLIDSETGNVLRRMVMRADLVDEQAEGARALAAAAISRRHPHGGRLGQRAWELRHNLTFYDGLYVALAEVLDCPLLTVDARLASATGPSCAIEVVGSS